MTNSPIFAQQLALDDYWQQIGGTVMLPGTNRAADRFVRASFYTHAIPQTADVRIGVASIFSVIRNCSVPYGISTPDQPNIASTRWRTVSDQKNKVYFYESVLTPNTFWLDLKDLDFKPGAPVKKLNLTNEETYNGNAVKSLKTSKPFQFLGLGE
jgi:penicillin V acylase-like amidase (Ntn superfamily)